MLISGMRIAGRIAVTRSSQPGKSSRTTAGLLAGLLALLLALALQPCFAGPGNHTCCGHRTGCHSQGQPGVCTMQSAQFLAPEQDAPAAPLASCPLPVAEASVVLPPAGSAAGTDRTPSRGSLYLVNSVLLI
ncbi:MAG: hypothetical protein KGN36_10425 [Acidobacteriota bacterium]|nr:hypothetical protein [Acidobacteriota bacterium]